MGWLGRKHGLQANALTAVEIVTADGELRRIDHDNETDLFWAVRGGGGNYGVVTALEFELFPAPEIYAGALFFPFERAPEVMHTWHELVSAGLPDEITTVARVYQFPPLADAAGAHPRQVVHRGPGGVPRQRARRRRADRPAHRARPGHEHVRHGGAGRARPPRHGPGGSAPGRERDAHDLERDAGDRSTRSSTRRARARRRSSPQSSCARWAAPWRGVPRAPARGPRSQGDYVMFAVGGVMSPEAKAEVQGQADGIAAALAPWDAGARYANFEERASGRPPVLRRGHVPAAPRAAHGVGPERPLPRQPRDQGG